MVIQYSSTLAVVCALAALAGSASAQTTVTLGAVDDVTLYENEQGALANGSGQNVFIGRNGTGLIRRALLKFDVAGAIPAGSVIQSANLRLRLSRNNNGTHAATVHTVSASWSEGGSDAGGNEGGGVIAQTGDATWLHRSYSTQFWANAGGDFNPAVRATTTVTSTIRFYEWRSSLMTQDVQQWLNTPSSNFGWMLRGDELSGSTAARFDSHESATIANRPQLVITYTTPPPCPADFNGNGVLNADDLADYIAAFFTVPAPLSTDFNGDGVVNSDDLSDYITAYFNGC